MRSIYRALAVGTTGVILCAAAVGQTPAPGAAPPPASTAPNPHPAHTSTSETDESIPKSSGAAAASTTERGNLKETAGTDPDPASVRAVTDFVTRASIDGMTEVQMGRLALTNSRSDQVRQFAEQMVSDHDASDAKLAAVASMKNVSVPKQLDADHQGMVQTLKAKQGPAFDAAYLNQLITAHTHSIALYTTAAGQSDSEVAAYAYRTLPTLKSHKQMAESLRASNKSAAAGAAKGS